MFLFLGDDGGGDDDDEEKLPSCADYVMHFVTLFWKLLFAFVPPTGEMVLSGGLPIQPATGQKQHVSVVPASLTRTTMSTAVIFGSGRVRTC
jgi:hypothetical protein